MASLLCILCKAVQMQTQYIKFLLLPFTDAFTEEIPKSPVRELLEMEPETAKFEWVSADQ